MSQATRGSRAGTPCVNCTPSRRTDTDGSPADRCSGVDGRATLLDRATGLDVRGAEYELVDAVRGEVVAAFPRGAFDRRFLAAIRREAAARPECQSARLLNEVGLADSMDRSPWRTGASPKA